MARKMILKIARLLGSALAAVAVTLICYELLQVNATTAAMFFLLAVLLIAAFWGLLESITAALSAVLCFNFFFLPPVLTFTIADPQNWVSLFTFLATAIIGSQLSSYARRQARESWRSKRETEKLYALSRTILLLEDHVNAASQIARHIVRLFDLEGAVIFDRYSSALHIGGSLEISESLANLLQKAASSGIAVTDEEETLAIAPIRLGADFIGSLATQGLFLSDGAQQAVLNLIAITLERERHREETTQAEAERKSERLKSTLLDAIAHEFKTPLTSIKVAATSLLSPSLLPTTAGTEFQSVRELVTVIDEEADRLTGLVTDAVQMARIEAGSLSPKKGLCKIDELMLRTVHDLERRRDGRLLGVQFGANLPTVAADADLLSLTLKLLLDNALKYSPPLSTITVSASRQDTNVVIRVHDEGAGIPEAEQGRLFEKFYRGLGETQVPGTGMGLTVAREIARAHGGDIRLESRSGEGTTFVLTIPAGAGIARDSDATRSRG